MYNSVVCSMLPELCHHCHSPFLGSLITPRRSPVPFQHHLPMPHSLVLSPRQHLICFLSQWICPSWTLHKSEIVRYTVLCGWLPSLSIMFSRLTHGVVCRSPSFLSVAEQYSIVWISHVSLTHTPVNRHLGCFHRMSVGNTASVSAHGQLRGGHMISFLWGKHIGEKRESN